MPEWLRPRSRSLPIGARFVRHARGSRSNRQRSRRPERWSVPYLPQNAGHQRHRPARDSGPHQNLNESGSTVLSHALKTLSSGHLHHLLHQTAHGARIVDAETSGRDTHAFPARNRSANSNIPVRSGTSLSWQGSGPSPPRHAGPPDCIETSASPPAGPTPSTGLPASRCATRDSGAAPHGFPAKTVRAGAPVPRRSCALSRAAAGCIIQ